MIKSSTTEALLDNPWTESSSSLNQPSNILKFHHFSKPWSSVLLLWLLLCHLVIIFRAKTDSYRSSRTDADPEIWFSYVAKAVNLLILQRKEKRNRKKNNHRCRSLWVLESWESVWRRIWVHRKRVIGRIWHWWAYRSLFMCIYLKR